MHEVGAVQQGVARSAPLPMVAAGELLQLLQHSLMAKSKRLHVFYHSKLEMVKTLCNWTLHLVTGFYSLEHVTSCSSGMKWVAVI